MFTISGLVEEAPDDIFRRFTDGEGGEAQDDACGADDDAGDAAIATFPLRALWRRANDGDEFADAMASAGEDVLAFDDGIPPPQPQPLPELRVFMQIPPKQLTESEPGQPGFTNGCSLVGTLCDGERAMKKVYYVPGFWPVCRGKPCCEPCNRWLTRKCILCRFKNLDVADVVKVEYGALKGASLCEGCFDEYAQTIAWPALNTEDCAKLRKKETKAVENICKTCGKHAQMVTQELQFCHNCVDFFEHGNCLYWTKELRDRFNPKGKASCYEDLSFAEGNQDIVTLKRGKSKGGKGSKSKAYLMVHRGGEWISANDLHLQEK